MCNLIPDVKWLQVWPEVEAAANICEVIYSPPLRPRRVIPLRPPSALQRPPMADPIPAKFEFSAFWTKFDPALRKIIPAVDQPV